MTRDKDGAKAAVYNVLIASSYVKIYASFRKYEKRVTDPQFIKMVSEVFFSKESTMCFVLSSPHSLFFDP